jgi:Flp pilus assembly protein TadD
LQSGRLDDAERSLEQALALDPTSVESWTNLGLVQGQAGRWSGAEASLRAALELSGRSADALFRLGVALQQQGRNEEARDLYEQALAADPGHPGARGNLRLLGR